MATLKHAKKQMKLVLLIDRCNNKKGKSKLDERKILRIVLYLRKKVGSFISKNIQVGSGITHIYKRTVRNYLNEGGYFCLQESKKRVIVLRRYKKKGKVLLKYQNIQDWTKLLEHWNFNAYWWEGISVQKNPSRLY